MPLKIKNTIPDAINLNLPITKFTAIWVKNIEEDEEYIFLIPETNANDLETQEIPLEIVNLRSMTSDIISFNQIEDLLAYTLSDYFNDFLNWGHYEIIKLFKTSKDFMLEFSF